MRSLPSTGGQTLAIRDGLADGKDGPETAWGEDVTDAGFTPRPAGRNPPQKRTWSLPAGQRGGQGTPAGLRDRLQASLLIQPGRSTGEWTGPAGSALDHLHLLVGVVTALGHGQRVQGGDLLSRELDAVGGAVLLHPAHSLGPRDGLPPDYEIVYKEIQRYLFKVGPVDLLDGPLLSGIVDFFEEGVAAGKGVLELIGDDAAAFSDDLIKDSKTYADIHQEAISPR